MNEIKWFDVRSSLRIISYPLMGFVMGTIISWWICKAPIGCEKRWVQDTDILKTSNLFCFREHKRVWLGFVYRRSDGMYEAFASATIATASAEFDTEQAAKEFVEYRVKWGL